MVFPRRVGETHQLIMSLNAGGLHPPYQQRSTLVRVGWVKPTNLYNVSK